MLPREPALTLQRFNDSPGAVRYLPIKQHARDERHNSLHDCSDVNVKERSDSDENQIEQQHSYVLCDHASVLRQADCVCTRKQAAVMRRTVNLHAGQLVGSALPIALSTGPGLRRSCRVKTSYRLEQ